MLGLARDSESFLRLKKWIDPSDFVTALNCLNLVLNGSNRSKAQCQLLWE